MALAHRKAIPIMALWGIRVLVPQPRRSEWELELFFIIKLISRIPRLSRVVKARILAIDWFIKPGMAMAVVASLLLAHSSIELLEGTARLVLGIRCIIAVLSFIIAVPRLSLSIPARVVVIVKFIIPGAAWSRSVSLLEAQEGLIFRRGRTDLKTPRVIGVETTLLKCVLLRGLLNSISIVIRGLLVGVKLVKDVIIPLWLPKLCPLEALAPFVIWQFVIQVPPELLLPMVLFSTPYTCPEALLETTRCPMSALAADIMRFLLLRTWSIIRGAISPLLPVIVETVATTRTGATPKARLKVVAVRESLQASRVLVLQHRFVPLVLLPTLTLAPLAKLKLEKHPKKAPFFSWVFIPTKQGP